MTTTLTIPFGSLVRLLSLMPKDLPAATILNIQDDGQHYKVLTGDNEVKSFILNPTRIVQQKVADPVKTTEGETDTSANTT